MKKKRFVADPFFEREKEKYEKPIPSREYILQHLEKCGRPVSYKKLASALEISTKEHFEALRRRLRAMERDGQLMQNRRGNYCLINKLDLIAGRIEAHPDGFGFVIPFDGSEDLFLNARQMRGILHGDHVFVREISSTRPGRREGMLIEIYERPTKRLVGKLLKVDGVLVVQSDNKRINQDILIPSGDEGDAQPEQMVVVELVVQPNLRSPLVGKVVELLGQHMAPGMEIDIALRSYELPHKWSATVQEEIKYLREDVIAENMESFLDIRDFPFVTIDGEDAKDFDDAVYCKKRARNSGWTLYVAIADVSHYVKVNTALDKEAFKRGNSVYFPGQVIPMLPEILSNGLCSLKPNVDRLCIVCEMAISEEGELQKYKFYEAVMHSKARLTYTEVAAVLSDDKKAIQKNSAMVPHLQNLYSLFQILHAAREVRGAIDFDLTETKILFDDKKKIKQIVPLVRNDAHRLIEECMLMANVSAAKFLEKHKIPSLFRVHPPPTASRIADVREFLREFGLTLYGGEAPQALDYTQLLKQIKNRPDASLIQTVLLRSLSQAQYLPKNEGHFGLAYAGYTHFTSPIRRYPDLVVHRAIRHVLEKKRARNFCYKDDEMLMIAEHCSMTERRADDATRDVIDWLKCEYLLGRVGEEFDGIITGVTTFGVFVELASVYVEGLVHVTALKNDYYHYDALRHHLRGERTNTTYRLGDSIRVRIARVNLEEKKIDFELI